MENFSEAEIGNLKRLFLTNKLKYEKVIKKYDDKSDEIDAYIKVLINLDAKSKGDSIKLFNPQNYEDRLKLKYNLSKYQIAALDFITHGTGNAVINAVAGSGKTTTIKLMASLIPRNISKVFLAFNKSIVKELRNKLPNHVDVLTMHSIGLSAMRAYYDQYHINININRYRSRQIVDKLLELGKIPRIQRNPKIKNEWYDQWKINTSFIDADINENHSLHRKNKQIGETWENYTKRVIKEYEFAYRQRIIKLADLIRLYLTKNETELIELADKYDIGIVNGEAKKAISVVRYMIQQNNNLKSSLTKEFDFIDMIFVPAISNHIKPPQYEWVFIDECQDLNVSQQRLMDKIIKPNIGRFVAVGDPQQSIYGFAGADIESFNKLRNKDNVTELPLSVNYRSGKKIIELAQTIVPHIEHFQGNGDGKVRFDGKIFSEVIEGDYILCRNTLPLVKLAYELLRMRKKVKIMGADIGQNLINLVRKYNANIPIELFEKLQKEVEKKEAQLKKKGLTKKEIEEHSLITSLLEKIEVIKIIADANDCNTISEIIYQISDLFSDEKKGIVLSTIHKAKGLESERVWIILKNLMPSKYATKDWELVQERNLEYVAYTRAINELIFDTEYKFEMPF